MDSAVPAAAAAAPGMDGASVLHSMQQHKRHRSGRKRGRPSLALRAHDCVLQFREDTEVARRIAGLMGELALKKRRLCELREEAFEEELRGATRPEPPGRASPPVDAAAPAWALDAAASPWDEQDALPEGLDPYAMGAFPTRMEELSTPEPHEAPAAVDLSASPAPRDGPRQVAAKDGLRAHAFSEGLTEPPPPLLLHAGAGEEADAPAEEGGEGRRGGHLFDEGLGGIACDFDLLDAADGGRLCDSPEGPLPPLFGF